MVKLISLMTRVTVLVGLMAALPSIARVTQLGKNMTQAGAAATQEDGGNPLLGDSAAALTGGEGLNLQGLNLSSAGSLLGLLGGESAATSKSKAKPSPLQPATFIHYVAPDKNHGKSAGTDVMQLPPGANATIVDGRLQVYYPFGKPKKAR